jgi:hypothetical protein
MQIEGVIPDVAEVTICVYVGMLLLKDPMNVMSDNENNNECRMTAMITSYIFFVVVQVVGQHMQREIKAANKPLRLRCMTPSILELFSYKRYGSFAAKFCPLWWGVKSACVTTKQGYRQNDTNYELITARKHSAICFQFSQGSGHGT